jgi:hypothetical protein
MYFYFFRFFRVIVSSSKSSFLLHFPMSSKRKSLATPTTAAGIPSKDSRTPRMRSKYEKKSSTFLMAESARIRSIIRRIQTVIASTSAMIVRTSIIRTEFIVRKMRKGCFIWIDWYSRYFLRVYYLK